MLTNRSSLVISLGTIAALAVFTISMLATSRPAIMRNSAAAYLQQRRGEWTAGVTSEQAYLDQRHGEQTIGQVVAMQPASQPFRVAEAAAAARDAQQAYLEYRRGEWNAGVNSTLASLNYRRGEWLGN